MTLALVLWMPWAFGANEPYFEFWLTLNVAGILLVGAVCFVLDPALPAQPCPVLLVLAGLVLWTSFQLAPLTPTIRAALSPNAGRLWAELLPTTPERLADGSVAPPPPVVLSLHPDGTRAFLARLLGAFLLYGVVRTQVTSAASFRRLAYALLANGAALSALGIAQFISSPRGQMYWTYNVPGAVFGPFVNRNHFPDYAALCFGLGAGLLVTRTKKGDEWIAGPASPLERLHDAVSDFGRSLQNTRNVYLLTLLGLILAGIVMSLSRGGLLAFAGGAAVALALRGRTERSATPVWPAVVILGLIAAGAVAWLGWSKVEARFASFGEAGLYASSRGSVWDSVWPQLPRFLAVGTGGGTFRWVEPLTSAMQGGIGTRYFSDHVHNEFLEALLEGGLPRLALTLLLIGFVLRAGPQAVRRWAGRSNRGLALGALGGLAALALHSVVEFGIHIPAIAVLALVIAAQLMAAAEPTDVPKTPGPAAYLVALTLIPLALWLPWDARQADQNERFRFAGIAALKATPPNAEQAVSDLRNARAWQPWHAETALALAQAELAAGQTAAGLLDLTAARNRAPLLPGAQARLAAARDGFAQADPAIQYLERARRLLPNEPDAWVAVGRQHLLDGRSEEAWGQFRQALELSDRALPAVLTAVGTKLSADELRAKVLPNRTDVLVAAATALHPDDSAARRPLYEQALQAPAARMPAQHRARGVAERGLGQLDDAIQSYRTALSADQTPPEWQYEYAEVLRAANRYDDAEGELSELVRRHPDDTRAKNLRAVVRRERELYEIDP